MNEGKNKAHSKQSDINRQEFSTLESRGQKAEEDYDNLDLSLLRAKTIDKFEERLEWL